MFWRQLWPDFKQLKIDIFRVNPFLTCWNIIRTGKRTSKQFKLTMWTFCNFGLKNSGIQHHLYRFHFWGRREKKLFLHGLKKFERWLMEMFRIQKLFGVHIFATFCYCFCLGLRSQRRGVCLTVLNNLENVQFIATSARTVLILHNF